MAFCHVVAWTAVRHCAIEPRLAYSCSGLSIICNTL